MLSSVLYILIASLAILAFRWILDYSIDEQLNVLASDFGHAIELDSGTPHFRDWLRVVKTKPAKSLASIQLFNANGNLLEHYGPIGPAILIKNSKQIEDFRLIVSPLTRNSQTVGFLQIALSTDYKDEALQKLVLIIVLLAPFCLLGLGTTSYLVSDVATAPIRENLNMLKQFIADASHELNTPLSIFQARADVLEKKLKRSNLDVEDVHIMSSATERMEKIVNDLMLLAEIEGGPASSINEIVQVDHVIKEIITEFQPKFDEKGIMLQKETCLPVSVYGSDEYLHKIISNLVENAWRYTERGGTVSISVIYDRQYAKIQVKDTGIGISTKNLPFIFDRFYRVDKSRSRASGGSGLGLSIVKALVDSKKGYVNVHSKLGEGSIFTVFLRHSP
jgi:signal transduction histidine kinase